MDYDEIYFGDLFPADQWHAKAIQFLVDGQDWTVAEELLYCDLIDYDIEPHEGPHSEGANVEPVLAAPRQIYDLLTTGKGQSSYNQILRAFRAVIPRRYYIPIIQVAARVADPGPNWRTDLMQAIEGKAVHNQAVTESNIIVWKNLRFRSPAEMRIAQALEDAKVLYLPNCKAALGTDRRENREPDFLVCHNGKWGILEVDGETFHPPSRTVEDHERDRLFKAHGIRVVEHFNWDECVENAPAVVAKFLSILERNG